MTASTNPAKESLRKEQREQRKAVRKGGKDAELDEALKTPFPQAIRSRSRPRPSPAPPTSTSTERRNQAR